MINFENRLRNLKARRQGNVQIDVLSRGFSLNEAYAEAVNTRENYETLDESSGVKYAVGAMAPVDPASTRVSIDEGNRVADTLISMLQTSNIFAEKRMQGSVALDIHIKGHSDVDMLIILTGTILVQTPKLYGSLIPATDSRPMKEIIAELRRESENKLTSRYYNAEVNCSGSKSIALEGGSLQRKVDIVPSCWYDTHSYQ